VSRLFEIFYKTSPLNPFFYKKSQTTKTALYTSIFFPTAPKANPKKGFPLQSLTRLRQLSNLKNLYLYSIQSINFL
jgi:hypothetical protein